MCGAHQPLFLRWHVFPLKWDNRFIEIFMLNFDSKEIIFPHRIFDILTNLIRKLHPLLHILYTYTPS